jgi:hypothetical protein
MISTDFDAASFRHFFYFSGITWLLSACATNPVCGDSDFVLMSEEQLRL